MKMHKTPDFWDPLVAWFLSIKEQGVAAALAGVMAFLRGTYNGDGWRVKLADAAMCAILAWFVKDLLGMFGAHNDLAYIASVMLGYMGTAYVGPVIQSLIGKKTGVGSDGK